MYKSRARASRVRREARKPFAAPIAPSPPHPSENPARRRSRRLLARQESAGFCCRLARVLTCRPASVAEELRGEISAAAAAVDSVSRGGNPDMGSVEKRRRQEGGAPGAPGPLVAPGDWVFRTPENRRTEPVRPRATQMMPALLHTTSRNKTLYEVEGDGFPGKVPRREPVEFDMGSVRRLGRFPVARQAGQMSPVVEEVMEMEPWQPSPFLMDRPQVEGLRPPRSAIRRINFDEGAATCSGLASPDMFTCFEPGVSPFYD